MKLKFIAALAAVAVLASCSSQKQSSEGNEAQTATAVAADLSGKWTIESIALSDTEKVNPAEQAPDASQYITFEGGNYFIQTNCNTMSGGYTVSGDTLTLGDGMMTQMACENMATEDALRQFLGESVAIAAENGTTVRLISSTPGRYIVLQKANEQK